MSERVGLAILRCPAAFKGFGKLALRGLWGRCCNAGAVSRLAFVVPSASFVHINQFEDKPERPVAIVLAGRNPFSAVLAPIEIASKK